MCILIGSIENNTNLVNWTKKIIRTHHDRHYFGKEERGGGGVRDGERETGKERERETGRRREIQEESAREGKG